MEYGGGYYMGFIYRYTDLEDNLIKYVGIVHTNRPLYKRIYEHETQYSWVKNRKWKIEYIAKTSRTTLEALEAHLIALYKTNQFYNRGKKNWGLCEYIPDIESEWVEYTESDKRKNEIKQSTHKKRLDKSFIGINEVGLYYLKQKIPPDIFNEIISIRSVDDIVRLHKYENIELFEKIVYWCDQMSVS